MKFHLAFGLTLAGIVILAVLALFVGGPTPADAQYPCGGSSTISCYDCPQTLYHCSGTGGISTDIDAASVEDCYFNGKCEKDDEDDEDNEDDEHDNCLSIVFSLCGICNGTYECGLWAEGCCY